LIQIDERAPDDVLAEIRAIPAIRFALLVEI